MENMLPTDNGEPTKMKQKRKVDPHFHNGRRQIPYVYFKRFVEMD